MEYEAARECDLITAGDIFGRSGYGVGLQKGSPWADKITLAILDFHESGKMEDLDNKWILQADKVVKCDSKDDNSPATLGLSNMRGVFILVGVGIVGGLALIVIEIIFKKHQRRKNKKENVAKTAVRKWKGNIEKRRTIRETNKRLKTNGGLGAPPMMPGTTETILARTPDSSVTLSVGSLPQRPIYPGEPSHPWRSPSVEKLESEDTKSDIEDAEDELMDEIPPPIPPHRTPIDRPKSASMMRHALAEEYQGHAQRYYDEVDASKNWRGSRERLLDRASHHMYANKLHRSVGSGLEQHHNIIKSPSSSDSSRKKKVHVVADPLLAVAMVNKVSSTKAVVVSPHQPPALPSMSRVPKQRSSKWSEAHDLLSSPEYPSTSSDLRMIPQPPPPPKAYYVQRHLQPTRRMIQQRPAVTSPLSHHPNAVLASRQRHHRNYIVSNDDSDV